MSAPVMLDAARGVRFAPEFLPSDPFSGEAAAAEQRVLARIADLGLERNVLEIERDGYTVLLPDQVAPRAFLDELRDRIIEISGRREGVAVDVENGATHSERHTAFGQVQFEGGLLLEDPIFEQALMNPAALAMITYLLGESCALNHMTSFVKGPGAEYLPMHVDQNRSGSPAPFPPYAQVANATWALTDYSAETGATCFVPGSHKLCRPPTYAEATDLSLFKPLECPAGSVIVWHGNTWHGAVPRRAPGVRVSLVSYFTRWYYPSVADLRALITPEMKARNGDRFAVLMRCVEPMWDEASPQFNPARFGLFA